MLIVALYMNDVPVPSAQVIVRNAQWTFLLGWNLIAVRSLITQCIHNPTPCGLIWASLTTSSKEISTYGSFFKSLKSQVSVASLLILLLSRHFAPSLLSPGNEVVALRLWHQWLSWHRGPGQKRSHMPLNPSSRGSQQISLVGVYEPPCPMLLFTMISAFISRQTSACPLLAYNTKLKSLNEE